MNNRTQGMVVVDLSGMPEVLAMLRKELAGILREVAQDEDPKTAARLHQAAAAFEAGVSANDL